MLPQRLIDHLKEIMKAHAINEMETLLFHAPDEMKIYVTFRQNPFGPESKTIDYAPDQIFFQQCDVEAFLMECNTCWIHNIRPEFGKEKEQGYFPYLTITLGDLKAGRLLHPGKLVFLKGEEAKIMRRNILIKLVQTICSM